MLKLSSRLAGAVSLAAATGLAVSVLACGVSAGLGGAVAGTPDPGKSGFGLMSAPGDTRTWAPQLHNGLIYLSDINRGVWVLRPNF